MNHKIVIGCDHAGFPVKNAVAEMLVSMGYQVSDFGTHSTDSVDYPDFVHPVSRAIDTGEADYGILMCGSGNGVAITANKYRNVRAALCWTEELAGLARKHNDANVLCLPVRFVSIETSLNMIREFLQTPFDGGRHAERVRKITDGIQ
jgi:ribose 5-phosphate isomerase B